MAVSVVKANYFNIEAKLKKALGLIGYEPKGDVVVIKPNAASAYGHYLTGDYTSPQLIEAFINIFPGREYVIAEGSAVGMKFMDAAKALGYARLQRKYNNVRLVDLESEPRVELDWKFGKISLPALILENEYVNMPKMKTHNLCAVTLGMKNQKGLINANTKKKFHWMDINEAIIELANVARPALTVVDGIIALEGNGPNSITGRIKPMGALVAGQDVVEVDNACLRLMKIDNATVPHVPEAAVEARGDSIERLAKRFMPPHSHNGMIKSGNIFMGRTGCSGCPESLSGGIRAALSAENIDKLPLRVFNLLKIVAGPSYFYIGRKNQYQGAAGNHICLGNCSKKFAEENGMDYIPGCPPTAADIRAAIERLG